MTSVPTPAKPGFAVWLTGLPCSGKSTISRELAKRIGSGGRNVEILDGDVVRTHLCRGLGFSKEDRDTNVRRVGFVANLLARNGAAVVVAVVSPYKAIRQELKRDVANLVEVFVDCPVTVCAERDVKGMYAQAKAGKIKNFTGVDDPYEAPDDPDIHIRTDHETVDESVQRILRLLQERSYI